MAYKTYYFRTADRQSFLDGLSQTASEEGFDLSLLISKDHDGNRQIDGAKGIFVPAGEWWETEPNKDGTGGTKGSQAIANIRTNDSALQQFLGTVAVGETRNGVERVDPTTPVRQFAT
jgi:hypothetical protein